MIILQSDEKQKSSLVELSLVLPVYNQEHQIRSTISRIKRILSSSVSAFEIIVVNDGSTDKTHSVLSEMTDKEVKVVSYATNKGKGHAVKEGVLRTNGKFVTFLDGDLDVRPDIIQKYLEELNNYDLVIASKHHKESVVYSPTLRKLLSRAFNLVVRISTGLKHNDTQAGLKVGNGNVMRTVFSILSVKRYAFDVELLTIATLLGIKIGEMPVEIKINNGFKTKEIWRMFYDVMAISYRLRIKKWYQRQILRIKES